MYKALQGRGDQLRNAVATEDHAVTAGFLLAVVAGGFAAALHGKALKQRAPLPGEQG